MGIVFEQPGPVSETSVGAGAAQVYGQYLQANVAQNRTLAGIYEAAASLAARHGGGHAGGGDMRPQSAPGMGGGGYGPGVMLPMPQQPRDDPLTQSENLRLQRLQNARSLIQQQVADGALTVEDGNNLLIQAQTGIDPLKGQQERAQTRLRNQQMEALAQQMRMATQQEQEATAFRARSMQDRTSEITASDGTVIGHLVQNEPNGRGTFVPRDPSTREALTPNVRNTIRNQVEAQVHRELHDWRGITVPVESRPAWTRDDASISAEIDRRERLRHASYGTDSRTPQGGGAASASNRVPGVGLAEPTAQAANPARVDQQVGHFQNEISRMSGHPSNVPPANPTEESERPSSVGYDRVRNLAQIATRMYNETPQLHRRMGGDTRRLGAMADMLLRAHNQGRGLTNQELEAYRALQVGIGSFRGADELRL